MPWDVTSELAVLGQTNGIYRLVELATGRELARLEDPEQIRGAAAFTPDGTKIIVAARNGLRVWDLRRIRAELAKLGLDWDAPRYPPAEEKKDQPPLEVSVDLGELGDRAKYTLILAFFPLHAEAYYKRGLAYTRFNQWKEAFADFDMAATLKPDHAEAHYQRGLIHARQAEFEKAAADFSRTIRLRPEHGNAYAERAHAYLGLEQWDRAIADISKALHSQADEWELWLGRGRAQQMQAHWQKAVADYSKAIDLKPDCAVAWSARGFAHLNLGQWQNAVADCSKALELKDLPGALLSRARIMPFINATQRQKIIAEQPSDDPPPNSLALLPDWAEVWSSRAVAFSQLGLWDKAEADWSKVVELQANSAEALSMRSIAHFRLGHWNKALADLTKALELQPDFSQAKNNKAWILASCPDSRLREPAQALELAKQAVEAAPKEGTFWATLGLAHYRTGDADAALRALKKSMELYKADDRFACRTRFVLAMVHCKTAKIGAARKEYDKAVGWMEKNQPQDEELRRFRAEADELMKTKK
jgi:tetratricopeptide (TPR) repeat protein